MKKRYIVLISVFIILAALFIIFGTKYIGNMSKETLDQIVKRDVVIFDANTIDQSVLDELVKSKVVVMGEFHNIKEHGTLMYQLSTTLNKDYGFSHFLLETPQAFSWIFEDYSMGIMPEVEPEIANRFWFYIGELKNIRQYNLSLPLEKRLQVSTIDINHSPFAFVMSLEYMQEFVKDPQLLENVCKSLRASIEDNKLYIQKVSEFKQELERNSDIYIRSLGDIWTKRLVKMVEVELSSHSSRNSSNYLFSWKKDKSREAIIKNNVDEQIKQAKGKVLINVGSNHAQKSPVRGTIMEWLGEYLVFKSPYAKNQTYCLLVIPAKGTLEGGLNGMPANLFSGRFDNELFGIIAEKAGEQRGFLSLSDEKFKESKVFMNFHYEMISFQPKSLYDGVLTLPEGTYVNPFPKK